MNARTRLALLTLLPAVLLALPVPAADSTGVSVKVTQDSLDFLIGPDLVGRYNKAETVAKPYLWPLYAPGNVPVTRGWPMTEKEEGGTTDHVHQKSAWFCHGDVILEGVEVPEKIKGIEGADFWSEAKGHGQIVCTRVGEPKVSKDHASIETRNEWRTAGGTKVLLENRTIHLYDLGGARLFVFDIDLTPAGPALTFGDTKEGSFGVRVNDVIREQKGGKGKIENADGKVGEKECWGQQSAWCDYSGPIGDRTVGIAVLDDPSNTSRACWHVRGYGLMAANPFGRAKAGFPAMKGNTDLLKLGKGEHLKLRYGILLHGGDAKEGKVAEVYQQFTKLK